MNFMKSAVLAAIVLAAPVAATAATVGFTEGNRSLVAGTTKIGDEANAPANTTFNLAAGDTVNLFGRIVSAADTYEIDSETGFTISFIFGGYTLQNGNTVGQSGFVAAKSNKNNQSTFSLTGGSTALAQNFTTNIISGNALIFSAGAGTYIFSIDNRFVDPSNAATYDLAISAVPLPAGGLLLLSALGGAVALRRRKAANA